MIFDTEEIVIGGTEWKTAPFRFSRMFTLGGGSGQSYIDVLLSGVSPLALTNALGLNYIKALGATEQRNLPSGYTQVEYLQSSGTQYIDTGYIANGGMAIEAKAAPGGTRGAYTFWIGSIGVSTENPDDTRNAIGANGNSLSWQKGRVFNGAGFALSNNNPVVVYINTIDNAFEGKANGKTIYVNPSSIQQTLTGLTTTVKIGYSDYSSATRAMTIYYFKMWNNNYELIQNLIPCRRNSDNVLGMYDTVTGNFLTNSGTGTFTAGADVVPSPDTPVDIICNNGVLKANRNLYSTEYHDKVLSQVDGVTVNATNSINISGMVDCTNIKSFIVTSAEPKGVYRIFKYRTDKTFINASSVGNIGYILTLEDNVGFFRIQYNYTNSSVGTENILIYNRAYNLNEIYTDGTQETVSIINGGTANAGMLLKVGDYKDNQELLTGNVTRNIGVKVLDGTEDWILWHQTYNVYSFQLPNCIGISDWSNRYSYCSHFNVYVSSVTPTTSNCPINTYWVNREGYIRLKLDTSFVSTAEQFKQYLADQYANGTPVIVVYSLATPTTETVTGQPLTASGNCTVTATGSLDNLELELSYKQSI